jgi:hypothetical protein
MKLTIPCAVIGVLAMFGCSTTSHGVIGTDDTANWLHRNETRSCTVTLKKKLHVQPIEGGLAAQSSEGPPTPSPENQLRLISGDQLSSIALEKVRRIEVVDHARGALDGVLIGAGVGALLGAGTGLVLGGEEVKGEAVWSSRSLACEVMAGILGLFGAISGAAVGGGVGHRNILVF